MPRLQFSLTCGSTRPGELVAVAGSWSSWKPVGDFSGHSFPTWTGVVDLPAEACKSSRSTLEYKFVITRNGTITKWEETEDGKNRTLVLSTAANSDVVEVPAQTFGTGAAAPSSPHHPSHRYSATSNGNSRSSANGSLELDAFEHAVVAMNAGQRSWRLRLAFVRSIFSESSAAENAAFDPENLDCLVTVSAYLSFLASGQVRCDEDRGHHRPNHLANEARRIEEALDALHRGQDVDGSGEWKWGPFVARSVFPHLPSHASQFTVSVPMTRIRDIAHRNDIPHELKQEIKHTVQNKLHRCAGPEDLQTCERILHRVSGGGYSEDFVNQLRIFHGELREFFNASSVDERLEYLGSDTLSVLRMDSDRFNVSGVQSTARRLLELKRDWRPAIDQLLVGTRLRQHLGRILQVCRQSDSSERSAPPDIVQKLRLADIELDKYAFLLMGGIAKEVEEQGLHDSAAWSRALLALAHGMWNMQLSDVLGPETRATASELAALAKSSSIHLDLVRTKAAVERARRATETFSKVVSDLYLRRVSSLAAALNVSKHAADVFSEAIIRTTVAFQSSRVADAMTRRVRADLGIPPWDALLVGQATGRVVVLDALSEASRVCVGRQSYVAICRTAGGDEDIPPNVRGVVLGHPVPHLSHLGVRARQAGVVFVSAENGEEFDRVWESAKSMSGVTLDVDALCGFNGLTESKVSEEEDVGGLRGAEGVNSMKPIELGKFDLDAKAVIPVTKATIANSAAKCAFAGQLAAIGDTSDGLFHTPEGVCLPFGVFKLAQERQLAQYDALARDYDEVLANKGEAVAADVAFRLRGFVERTFTVDKSIISAIQNSFSGPEDRSRVMVRSSANCEDLEDLSGAGLYDSIANVNPWDEEALEQAIVKVWGSLWTRRAASSRAAYRVPHSSACMAVLVQRMVSPVDLSFVAFSRNPVDCADDESIYIELAVGMGETLASGAVAGQPYRLRVNRTDLTTVTVDSMASYGVQLMPSDEPKQNLRQKVVDYSRQRMTVDEDFRVSVGTAVAKTVLHIEKSLGGGPQDTEGVISLGLKDRGRFEISVVQARPQVTN